MSQDTLILCGQITSDSGNFKTDGAGNVAAATLAPAQQTGTVTTLITGNTITPGTSGGSGCVRVTAAGAITGVIIAAGVKAGQMLTVICEQAAANTITMAAAGTSNVAAGATCVLSGLAAHQFIWDAVTALWYQTGPATN